MRGSPRRATPRCAARSRAAGSRSSPESARPSGAGTGAQRLRSVPAVMRSISVPLGMTSRATSTGSPAAGAVAGPSGEQRREPRQDRREQEPPGAGAPQGPADKKNGPRLTGPARGPEASPRIGRTRRRGGPRRPGTSGMAARPGPPSGARTAGPNCRDRDHPARAPGAPRERRPSNRLAVERRGPPRARERPEVRWLAGRGPGRWRRRGSRPATSARRPGASGRRARRGALERCQAGGARVGVRRPGEHQGAGRAQEGLEPPHPGQAAGRVRAGPRAARPGPGRADGHPPPGPASPRSGSPMLTAG